MGIFYFVVSLRTIGDGFPVPGEAKRLPYKIRVILRSISDEESPEYLPLWGRWHGAAVTDEVSGG